VIRFEQEDKVSGDQERDEDTIQIDPARREEILRELREQKGEEAVRDYIVSESVDRLSKAKPEDVQEIATASMSLLNAYHNEALGQSRKSFNLARVLATVGLGFFLFAVVWLLVSRVQDVALASVVGGAIVEVVSGIVFYLYGKTSNQLAEFQSQLDRTQRFLLANSVCSAIEGEAKDKTRAELVRAIAGIDPLQDEEDPANDQDQEE
jgi:hypothetical protein